MTIISAIFMTLTINTSIKKAKINSHRNRTVGWLNRVINTKNLYFECFPNKCWDFTDQKSIKISKDNFLKNPKKLNNRENSIADFLYGKFINKSFSLLAFVPHYRSFHHAVGSPHSQLLFEVLKGEWEGGGGVREW